MYESGTLYILFMFEHVALMATFRVLIQCIMITGIKIRKSFFLTRTYIRHQLLKTTLVVLIEKERVDIFHVFPSSSSLINCTRRVTTIIIYLCLYICVETFKSEEEEKKKKSMYV
jgi:hypothetical protein